jgi:transposase
MTSLVYYKNKTNNTTYVYQNTSTWNKQTKQCNTKRTYIGKLDPNTGNILPTNKHAKHNNKEQTIHHQYATVQCQGPTLILDKTANTLNLPRHLQQAFPDNYQKILTCAYYLISEGKPLSHIETWSTHHTHPYNNQLTNQRISELLKTLSKEKQLPFFTQWIKKHAEKEYIALDITSVSSYSKQNQYVRYGYNRDGENLPQINLCLLLGQTSRLPLYYESLNGSIKDVSTLENVLKMMTWLKATCIHPVMDKGFFSEHNIDCLYEHGFLFTVGVPFTPKWTRELVAKVREGIERFSCYHHVGGRSFFATTDNTSWKGRLCYRHVYFDSKKASEEYMELLEKLGVRKKELEENCLVEGNEVFYERYFRVIVESGGDRRVEVCEGAVLEFKLGVAGFFVLLSNDISDAVEAYKVYREKDVVEKGFDNLKNALDMNRLRVHDALSMDGRLFVQFVAQVISLGIRKVMADSKLDERYTLPELINELKSFHSVSLEGQTKPIFSKISKAQREIFTAFNINKETYV